MKDNFDVDFPHEKWKYIERFTGMRFIQSNSDLDRVSNIRGEFCISRTFHPQFINEVCTHGYFPMSIPFDTTYMMAVKVHKQRCVLKLDNLHVERKARKNAGKYLMSMDSAFEEVVQLIVVKNGENWLCKKIQNAFRVMFNHPEQYKTKIHSCEVWCDGILVAGELGYVVGDIYTSLTGAYQLAGTGTVQLCTLGKLLKQRGYQLWDFGMSMDYKINLGSITLSRDQWLDLFKQHRDRESPSLKLEGKIKAREIIDYDLMTQIPVDTEKKRKKENNRKNPPNKAEEEKEMEREPKDQSTTKKPEPKEKRRKNPPNKADKEMEREPKDQSKTNKPEPKEKKKNPPNKAEEEKEMEREPGFI